MHLLAQEYRNYITCDLCRAKNVIKRAIYFVCSDFHSSDVSMLILAVHAVELGEAVTLPAVQGHNCALSPGCLSANGGPSDA
jgi:hypothetical protein